MAAEIQAERWFYPCFCTECGTSFESGDTPEVCPECAASHGLVLGPLTGVMPRKPGAMRRHLIELSEAELRIVLHAFDRARRRDPKLWLSPRYDRLYVRLHDHGLAAQPSPRAEGKPAEGKVH